MRPAAVLVLVVPAFVVVAGHRLSEEPRSTPEPFPGLWEDARHNRHPPVAPNCPLVLSLDPADPFALTPPERGVMFDIDADGNPDRVAWTQAGSKVAFLALDRNGDGRIGSGEELVGKYTHPEAINGPTALAALASDALPGERRGAIDGSNPIFGDLLLWTDSDHDGISQPGELRPAEEVVARIGLGYTPQHSTDPNGNESRYRGFVHVRTEPGLNMPRSAEDDRRRVRPMYDVCLVTSR